MDTVKRHRRDYTGPLRTLLAAFLLCAFARAASAGTEEGVAAYKAADYDKALEEFEPLAEQGNPTAQYYLARMYGHGQGVEKDFERSLELFRSAADAGNAKAMVAVGYSYDEGIGVEANDKKAVELYRKAAEAGDPVAQRNLGLMYEEGEGVDYDAREGARWFRRAADQGDPVALTHLGQLTWMGQGDVPRDRGHALELLHRAARQDHAHAQYLYCSNMSEVYGQSTDALVKAFKWCKLAADQGYPGGEKMWEAAERWFLSAEQKRRAAELAAEWSAKHR